nr:cupin domain-containing protein [Armatimonas sp.]
MHPRAQALIETLQLAPHPEGGYYREVFRSAETVTPSDGRPIRSALTTIYFLLPAGAYSRWHKVLSDEV